MTEVDRRVSAVRGDLSAGVTQRSQTPARQQLLFDARMLRAFDTGTGRTIVETLPILSPRCQVIANPLDDRRADSAFSANWPHTARRGRFGRIGWMAAEGLAMTWNADLVMQPWMFGRLGHGKTVLGVYDLIPLRLGQLKRNLLLHRLSVVRRRADVQVFTLAQATAQRLVDFGIGPDTVHVATPGIDHIQLDEGPSGLKAEPPYVAIVGRISPHKGLDVAVRAWRQSRPNFGLTVIIPAVESRSRIARAWSAQGVKVLSAVRRNDLVMILREAEAVICPSLEEGYGLSLTEAAMVGAKVIASDLPVFREQPVGAVTWVRPGSVDDLAEALAEVATQSAAELTATPPTWDAWRETVAAVIQHARAST